MREEGRKTFEKKKYAYTFFQNIYSYITAHKIIKSWIFIANQRLISEKLKPNFKTFLSEIKVYILYITKILWETVARYFLSVFLWNIKFITYKKIDTHYLWSNINAILSIKRQTSLLLKNVLMIHLRMIFMNKDVKISFFPNRKQTLKNCYFIPKNKIFFHFLNCFSPYFLLYNKKTLKFLNYLFNIFNLSFFENNF